MDVADAFMLGSQMIPDDSDNRLSRSKASEHVVSQQLLAVCWCEFRELRGKKLGWTWLQSWS